MCVVNAAKSILSPLPVCLISMPFTPSTVKLTRSSDDVTVEVIFFGQGPDSRTGIVEINEEASASEEPPKAKL